MKEMQMTLQNIMKIMLDEGIKQIKEQMISIDLKNDNMQKQFTENTKMLKDISKKIDKKET